MNISDITPGEFYLIKGPQIWGNAGLVTKVFQRIGDKDYPFEVTAARLGVKADEIFPPTNKANNYNY